MLKHFNIECHAFDFVLKIRLVYSNVFANIDSLQANNVCEEQVGLFAMRFGEASLAKVHVMYNVCFVTQLRIRLRVSLQY